MLKRRALWFLPLFFLPLGFWGCSDGVSCSGAVCGAGEVCDAGKCVLGLSFDQSEEGAPCESDSDCSEDKICTAPNSKPPSTCIPQLDCDLDGDCQSGLTCARDNVCR
jgi:hypothetical protein